MENSNMHALHTLTRRLISLVAVFLAALALSAAAQTAERRKATNT
jgi:hypothetical protein